MTALAVALWLIVAAIACAAIGTLAAVSYAIRYIIHNRFQLRNHEHRQ